MGDRGLSDSRFGRPIHILMVEDNPGDVRLAKEALRDAKVRNEMVVASDGERAMEILTGAERLPDLVLLDLNLPKKHGREVLAQMKSDDGLKRIPVVVLTSSQAEEDVLGTYDLHANCYITKPLDLDQFVKVVNSIEDFWLTIVTLPPVSPAR